MVKRELYTTTELIKEVVYLVFSVKTAARSNVAANELLLSDTYLMLRRDLHDR